MAADARRRGCAGSGAEPLDKLSAFVRALGAEPRIIDVEAHDRIVAFLSHLPQLTASALMQVVGDSVGEEGLALAGRGLADTTRLASSPPTSGGTSSPRTPTKSVPALDALIGVLLELRGDLSAGEQLTDVFTAANRWRDCMGKKAP